MSDKEIYPNFAILCNSKNIEHSNTTFLTSKQLQDLISFIKQYRSEIILSVNINEMYEINYADDTTKRIDIEIILNDQIEFLFILENIIN